VTSVSVCLSVCLLVYLINNTSKFHQFLGHLLRDDLMNPVKMSVRPSVRTSTMKHNAATYQIVIFVKVDETFTTI